jgi:hypothetical protein
MWISFAPRRKLNRFLLPAISITGAASATPMRRMPNGCWLASLELHHGHHHYLFLVDGTAVLDPHAHGIARNDQNEPVSLIAVS